MLKESTQAERGAAVIRPSAQPVADRGGGTRTIPLVTPRLGAQQLINGITIIAPGAAIPLHFHDCEESVIVLEGHAIAMIDGVAHAVGPGDTSWIPPGMRHFFRDASEDASLRIFWTYASVTATRTLVETGQTRPIAAEHAAERLVQTPAASS